MHIDVGVHTGINKSDTGKQVTLATRLLEKVMFSRLCSSVVELLMLFVHDKNLILFLLDAEEVSLLSWWALKSGKAATVLMRRSRGTRRKKRKTSFADSNANKPPSLSFLLGPADTYLLDQIFTLCQCQFSA